MNAVGLPLESIGLLLSVDWLLERLRTVGNIMGDAFGLAIIDNFEKKENIFLLDKSVYITESSGDSSPKDSKNSK